MPAAVMTATFQNIHEALQVGIDVGVRILQRMANAGLGRKMKDMMKLLRRKQRLDRAPLGEIELDEAKSGLACELLQPRFLERRIVVRRKVVDTDDTAPCLNEAARHMRADEAGGAGHQHRLVRRHAVSIPSGPDAYPVGLGASQGYGTPSGGPRSIRPDLPGVVAIGGLEPNRVMRITPW